MVNLVPSIIVAVFAFCIGSFSALMDRERAMQTSINEVCMHIGTGIGPDFAKDVSASVHCEIDPDGRNRLRVARAVRREREVAGGYEKNVQLDGILVGAKESSTYHKEPW